jgi:hypothetical protein
MKAMLKLGLIALCALGTALAAVPETHLTVQVNAADTGKPVDRASVIVKFRHGRGVNMKKIRTTWETKTGQDGLVKLPSIPQGEVTVQIIAEKFQTFGDVYELNQPEQTINIKLNPPQAQYSEHEAQKKKQ